MLDAFILNALKQCAHPSSSCTWNLCERRFRQKKKANTKHELTSTTWASELERKYERMCVRFVCLYVARSHISLQLILIKFVDSSFIFSCIAWECARFRLRSRCLTSIRWDFSALLLSSLPDQEDVRMFFKIISKHHFAFHRTSWGVFLDAWLLHLRDKILRLASFEPVSIEFD